MKPIFWVLVFLIVSPFLMAAVLYAGDDMVPVTDADWALFLASIKGFTGLGALGIAGAATQLILLMIRSGFINLPGRYKLLTVQALSIITGMTTLHIGGFDWPSAFLHANTLGAAQVFGHQILKQWNEGKERTYELPPPRS